MLPQNIAIQIRSKRKKLHWTIEELAEKSDVSVSLISRLERNTVQSVNLDKLLQILAALDLQCSDIFGAPNWDEPTNKLFGLLATMNPKQRKQKVQAIIELLS